jgi:hypothetical protein
MKTGYSTWLKITCPVAPEMLQRQLLDKCIKSRIVGSMVP